MQLLRMSLLRIIAAIAFVAFSSDLVAEIACETSCCGNARTEKSSHGDDDCTQCICITHPLTTSASLACVPAFALNAETNLSVIEEEALAGISPAIEHPPRLA